MAANYCKNCGATLSPESKFCENCGKTVDAAPTVTQESYKAHQAATPPLTPSSRLGAAFYLALIGGIFGIFIGSVLIAISLAWGTQSLEGWLRDIGLVVFSIIGIVGALRIVDKRDTINAGLMIIAGVGVLVSALYIGIFSALLLFMGGVLLYLKKG
jgi:zinc-ribbon domain